MDALAKDARALLAALDGRELDPVLGQAAKLLATVTGQDLEEGAGGVFRIARKVAADRVISTVDPQARHGHKTSARGFDGYKGHVAVDPDSEIITATEATPGNSGDAEVAESLLGDMLPGDQDSATAQDGGQAAAPAAGEGQQAVYGDAAYGSGELIGRLDDAASITASNAAAGRDKGHFPKDRFAIDLDAKTVTCPADITAPIRASGRDRHAGEARFGAACGPARWPPSAPAPRTAARSPSARTRPGWPPPGRPRQTRPGRRTTGRPGPRWNARSAISCAAATAAAARGSAGWSRSPLTSDCLPPRSTWPASACSELPTATAPGRSAAGNRERRARPDQALPARPAPSSRQPARTRPGPEATRQRSAAVPRDTYRHAARKPVAQDRRLTPAP